MNAHVTENNTIQRQLVSSSMIFLLQCTLTLSLLSHFELVGPPIVGPTHSSHCSEHVSTFSLL